MTEYTSAIDLAARLIIKKGREVTFRHFLTEPKSGQPSGPDDEPWEKDADDKGYYDQKLKMVFLDYVEKEIDGTPIKSGKKQVLMFAKGVKYTPNTTDKIIELPKNGGKTWNITEAEPLQPGEEAIMFTLIVSR